MRIDAGSQVANQAGDASTCVTIHSPPAANTTPPGSSSRRWPTRAASRPMNGAVIATSDRAGVMASPARSTE